MTETLILRKIAAQDWLKELKELDKESLSNDLHR
jgi:hypothetical protein